ncbi:MAG TPA: ABC transporter ATP-binding protein [Terriglobia bacterium]|nr:ABC transporter ATP-binding protein [Terriglobia bacterium]
MSQPAIEIENLTKTYRSGLRRNPVFAVRNLSLTVRQGTISAFVGPNGAGKTTTIHSLLGLLNPDSGRLKVFGGPAGTAAARARIGYQSEIFHPYPFYTVAQALRYYGQLAGVPADTLARAVPAQLERLGISEAGNRRTSGLSKGMTQRLGLAQALLHEPELLILDEPTSGLDPEGRRLVLEIIREEKAKGKTVFLSSHILADVERVCDEVVMIRRGEVAFADQISSFGAANQDWAIEVLGFTSAVRESLEPDLRLLSLEGEVAVLLCDSSGKRELLRKLVELPVEIGAIQRHRGSSLEDAYMKHVGRA